jgi:hypothetical protein
MAAATSPDRTVVSPRCRALSVVETLVQLGRTPDEAVRAVRRARGPWALTNPGFVDYLAPDDKGALLSHFEPPSRLGLER